MGLTRILVCNSHGHFGHVNNDKVRCTDEWIRERSQCYLLKGRANKAPARLIVGRVQHKRFVRLDA